MQVCELKAGWYTGIHGDFPTMPTSGNLVQAPPPTLAEGQAACWYDGAWVIVPDQGQADAAGSSRRAVLTLAEFFDRLPTLARTALACAAHDGALKEALKKTTTAAEQAALLEVRERLLMMTTVDVTAPRVVSAVVSMQAAGLLTAPQALAALKP